MPCLLRVAAGQRPFPGVKPVKRSHRGYLSGFFEDRGRREGEYCCRMSSDIQVFLETERLVLRRFTMADVDSLTGLDADPDVMRFVNGGIPTSRDEIENEFLPAFLSYYER